jgi:hypothetical protein
MATQCIELASVLALRVIEWLTIGKGMDRGYRSTVERNQVVRRNVGRAACPVGR